MLALFQILQYFLAVAKEENITKAAALLHITQPTLSRQLIIGLAEKTAKELEHEEETVSGEILIGCGETRNRKPLSKKRLESGILDMGLLLEAVEISRYYSLYHQRTF